MAPLSSVLRGWDLPQLSIGQSPVLEAVASGVITPSSGAAIIDEAVGVLVRLQAGVGVEAEPLGISTAGAGGYFGGWLGFDVGPDAGWGVLALSHEWHVCLGVGVRVLESVDVFLLIGELALAVVVLGGGLTALGGVGRLGGGYADIVSFCQLRSISMAEVFSLVTVVVGFVLFDVFITLGEDDALEAVSYVFLGVLALALGLLALGVDVQYYFLIASTSGGEWSLRLLYADVVNNGLCLLRIGFCWVRYLFYDFQAEAVDFVFHYTETLEEGLGEESGWFRSLV
jgi:hypothetical protein